MIVAASVFLGILIITVAVLRRRGVVPTVPTNPDLEKYYEMMSEPLTSQFRQLILAAKTTMVNAEAVAKHADIIADLHSERVVSDEYYNNLKAVENELFVEKLLIESEADMLKPGSKETVFIEGKKLQMKESTAPRKKKLFDDALYMKRKEALEKELKARLSASKVESSK